MSNLQEEAEKAFQAWLRKPHFHFPNRDKAFKDGYIAGYEASPKEVLKDMLDKLTDEQRYELFGNYCRYCGCKDPMCACWNDE